MKKMKFIPFFVLAMLLNSCTDENADADADKAILATVKVRSEFEQSPPNPEEVAIELLEQEGENGENVLLTANFPKRELEKINDEFIAIQFEGEKVVLRDDGKGGDEKKGDGKFSIRLKEDIKELEESLKNAQEESLSGKKRTFDNARGVQQIDQKLLRSFDVADLSKIGKLIIPDFIIPGIFGAPSTAIDAERSLLITDIGVVEDPTRTFNPCNHTGNPNGVWTFGELMRQMASPSPAAIANDATTITFIESWLDIWNVNHSTATGNAINGDDVPSRNISILKNIWLSNSASAGAAPGQLLLECIPFKLTAIVNRLDLRGNSGYGFSDAGEGRLVFCAMSGNCAPMEFNVIFEYGINKSKCVDVKAFGQEWADLSTIPIGSVPFNNALEAITMQFTQSGTNTSKPSQNSINQIRTNEIALSSPWELREFNLNGSGVLELVDVKMEPAFKYNQKNGSAETQLLANFANLFEADIIANNYEIPLQLSTGQDFRGGKAFTLFPPVGVVNTAVNTPSHWDGSTSIPNRINNNEARHILSLNTCSGCHGGETQTSFTHIDPAPFGTPAGLSGFLTGTPGRSVGGIAPIDADGLPNGLMSVNDPAGRPVGSPSIHSFNDLDRRANDLTALISTPCKSKGAFSIISALKFTPLKMSH